MSSQLAKKLLVIAIGVLCLLLAALYQIKSNSPQQTQNLANRQDISVILRNSLIQQKRYFQRCWLQNSESKDQRIWQIFLTIQSNGRVKNFELLNKSLFPEETEKCLRDISMRFKFPAFEGEEISFTIPITISALNENH